MNKYTIIVLHTVVFAATWLQQHVGYPPLCGDFVLNVELITFLDTLILYMLRFIIKIHTSWDDVTNV